MLLIDTEELRRSRRRSFSDLSSLISICMCSSSSRLLSLSRFSTIVRVSSLYRTIPTLNHTQWNQAI